MDNLEVFLIGLIAMGVVLNIIGWTDYYPSRRTKAAIGKNQCKACLADDELWIRHAMRRQVSPIWRFLVITQPSSNKELLGESAFCRA